MSVESTTKEPTYFYPKKFLALLPALYAWQIYDWKLALATFVAVLLLLSLVGWLYYAHEWSDRRLIWARVTIIVLSLAAVGTSAVETCSADGSECRRVFGGERDRIR